jgi:hypothetical protein
MDVEALGVEGGVDWGVAIDSTETVDVLLDTMLLDL